MERDWRGRSTAGRWCLSEGLREPCKGSKSSLAPFAIVVRRKSCHRTPVAAREEYELTIVAKRWKHCSGFGRPAAGTGNLGAQGRAGRWRVRQQDEDGRTRGEARQGGAGAVCQAGAEAGKAVG